MTETRAAAEPGRDEFLRTALRHAPDRDLTPPSGLSQAILAAARQRHRPPAKPVVEPVPARAVPERRVPWSERLQWLWTPRYAGGLATVLVGALVVGLWMNEEPPPPVASRDRGGPTLAPPADVVPPPPAHAASAAAAPPQLQPAAARSSGDARSGVDSAGAREARTREAAPALAKQKSPAAAPAPAAAREPSPRAEAAVPQATVPLTKQETPPAATAGAPISESRRDVPQSSPAALPAREQAPRDAKRGDEGAATTARARADETDRHPAAVAAVAGPATGADAASPAPPRALRELLDAPTPPAPAVAASAASPALTLWRRAGAESAARTAIWTWQTGEASSPRSFDATGQEWLLRMVQAARGRWVDVAQATDHGAAIEARWWRDDQPVARLRIEAQGLRWLEPSGRIRYAPLEPAALERLRAF